MAALDRSPVPFLAAVLAPLSGRPPFPSAPLLASHGRRDLTPLGATAIHAWVGLTPLCLTRNTRLGGPHTPVPHTQYTPGRASHPCASHAIHAWAGLTSLWGASHSCNSNTRLGGPHTPAPHTPARLLPTCWPPSLARLTRPCAHLAPPGIKWTDDGNPHDSVQTMATLMPVERRWQPSCQWIGDGAPHDCDPL